MSSSEEYLESLLKSIMDGGNAVVSNSDADKPKSAIEMLTGEEPENVGDADAVNMSRTLSPEEIDAMFHPAHKILESEPWPAPENMSKEDSETRMDLASLGLEEISENNQDDPNGLDNLGDLSDLNAHNDQDTLDSLGDLNGLSNLDDLGDLRGLDDFLHEEQNSEDVLGEMALEESNLEEMALEESNLEEMALEESNLEEMALEESDLEEMALKESNLEEMALEESGLGEMGLEESGLEEMALEESNLEEMALEESDLKEIALEEPDLGEMALEESDLGEIALEESDMDDMILEESGEEDLDFSGMDDDLAEIGDLLKQSGQDDDIDDEMLALLSSVSDDSEESEDDIDPLAFLQDEDSMTEEEVDVEVSETETDGEEEDKKDKKRKKKEKKKKEKKSFFSRKKKKFEKETDDPAMDKVLAAADGELSEDISAAREVESGQDNAEVKKSGFFSKMATLLTESDDDEEDGAAKALDVTDELFDENKELLRELDQEDRKSGKKEKANKKKEKKEKKDKKSKKVARKDAEGAEETKKKKKPKKEKKVKEKVEEPQEPEKKISKKKVIPVILCCLTITVCVVLLSTVVPGYLQARDAHIAFDMANYEEAYDLLQGQRLSEDDELIMQKSRIILYLDRKIDSYRGYKKFGKDLEALNALIEGCALYYELLPDAETYNMTDQIRTVYGEILVLLSDEYGVSESTVMDILAYEDDVTYTEHLTAIITGESYSAVSGSETEIEAETLTVPDVLPEEQEILDNMPVEIN